MKIVTRTGKGSQLTQAEMDANLAEIGSLGSDVASAATVNLESAVNGRKTKITGTTTISSFGSTAHSGALRELEFAGAITLTHGASAIVCPGSVDLKLQSGDRAWVVHEGSGKWIVYEVMFGSHKVRRWRKDWKAEVASSTSYTADWSEYAYLQVQATGNVATVGFTAPPVDKDEVALIVRGDGTQRTWGWSTSIDWGAAGVPVMPTATDDYLEIRGILRGSRMSLTWDRFGY